MRSFVPARLALFNREPFSFVHTNDLGRQRMNGIGILIDYVNLLSQIRFNFTYVQAIGLDIGRKDDNGNYTGLFGLIQSDQADLSLIFAPLDLVDPPGKLGPVLMSFNYHIYSAVMLSSTNLSLGQCLAVFDTTTVWFSFLLVILLGGLVCRNQLLNLPWWTFGRITKQTSAISFSLNCKLWVGMMASFLVVIHALFSASYTTDVSTEKPPKRVDTLQHLIDEDRKPIWFIGDSTFMYFKHGISEQRKRIWLKAENTGLKECFIDYSSALNLLNQDLLVRLDNALLFVEYVERAVRPFICNRMWEFMKESMRIFESEPFATSNQAILMTNNASEALKNRVEEISQRIMENGLFRDSIDRLSYQTSPTPPDSNCIRNIGKVERKDSVVEAINFERLGSVIMIAALLVLAASFILVFELLLSFGLIADFVQFSMTFKRI